MTIAEKLRREAARGNGDDGSECCYAPKWTCCDKNLLTESAAEIERLQSELDGWKAKWLSLARAAIIAGDAVDAASPDVSSD